MPALLTTASTLMCPHGGTVLAAAGSTRAQAGAAILRSSDSCTITGCAFSTPAGPQPCLTVNWMTTATRVRHGGDFVLTEESLGLCMSGEQVPQGSVLVSATQPGVSGQ